MLISLDPGQGGWDSGAFNPRLGVKESNINLQMALRMATIFERAGCDVHMTRTTDVALGPTKAKDLGNRVRAINKMDPDLILSIHNNGVTDTSVHGFEVFAIPGRTAEMVARSIHKHMKIAVDLTDRGVKEPPVRWDVIYKTLAPAVLLEYGFVTNDADCHRLLDVTYQQSIALATVFGVMDCKLGG